MTKYFIVPGIGNSGADHWQTYFEDSSSNILRIPQVEWEAPECSDWVANIQYAVSQYDAENVVLIAHSLGCMAVAHWAAQYGTQIKGALLVAPSDAEAVAYNFSATGFSPIPLQTLPFKSLVVASTNDPWVTLERAQLFAENWGSELVNIGAAGHINVDSGYGKWEHGLELLKRLE